MIQHVLHWIASDFIYVWKGEEDKVKLSVACSAVNRAQSPGLWQGTAPLPHRAGSTRLSAH